MQANRVFALFCVGVCGLGLVPAGAGAPGAVAADVAPVPAAKVHPLLRQMAAESAEPVKTWVFFADKGLTNPAEKTAAVRSVAASYNPRAIQRRIMRGEHARRGQPIFGEWDLPVCAAYADAVAATGARVHVRSKWVNALSVWATPAQIDEIAKLPFVVKMQPVARRARIDLPEPQQPADVPEAGKDPVRGETSINYGLSQPQLSQINLIALHDAGYTGQGVVIGILDTGFERSHVAFNNPAKPVNVIAEYDFVDDDPVTSKQTGDPSSQHEHGTMILGCIGSYQPGSLVGGAFDASFILAKTEDTTGEYPAEEDNYVAGLEFIEFHGADMSTSSLGYIDWYTQAQLDGLTAVTTIAINTHTALGVHHCNAAGNEYHDSNPATSSLIAPADGFQVITCGAVTSSGSIASFSSDGPTADGRIKPEVLALGSGTDTVDPFSTTGYTTASGTSLSTPLVASALACLIQARPYWTVDRMRERLFETGSDFVANGQPDPLFVRGYGIVDAFAAYDVCSDAGSVVLDSNVYACDGTISILVNDCGLNTDDNVAETVTVTVASDSEPLGELVLLTETDPAAAEFTGEISLSTTDAAGVLWVDHADLVTVTYIDADDGAGGVNVPVTAPAAVDCLAPAIQNVQTTAVQPRSAVVQITANEAVKGTVHYGTTCGTWTGTTPGAGYANPTQVSLTGLQDDTTYYYAVEAEDRAGNTSSDDNGGACYTFTTPEIPDFFTELFDSNNDLDNLTLTFT
ncbi:MAG: S8 family serine peptidase, partial [Phycisphaerae bacterium]|nr:S8 family serine peptidase [Phycisphaerae bacterium]